MKAIVQMRYGSPDGLELRDIEQPAVGDDQLLIEVQAASLKFADWGSLKLIAQLFGLLLRQPRTRVRGYDLAGRVADVGKNVTQWKPGDEVFGVRAADLAVQ